MKNYEKDLYKLVKKCHELHEIGQVSYFPKIALLKNLMCKVEGIGLAAVQLTPHYKYFHRRGLFQNFFKNARNDLELYYKKFFTNNSGLKMESASNLLADNSSYLEGVYRKSVILVDEENCIIDGNLRAARLLSLGATHVVVLERRGKEFNYACAKLEFDQNASSVNLEVAGYLAKAKVHFKEWYSPLELGPYKLPKITYPDFQEIWNFDEGEGIRNWHSSIKHVVPDVTGKRILDVGSNVGLYSLELSRIGADVCGVDRGPKVVQANNHLLGAQSVPNQAYAIRNVYEVYYGERLRKVAFAEIDLMKFNFSDTKCDLFFSCRTLYHLGEKKMSEVIHDVSENIPEIILQSNEGHVSGELGRIASMEFHRKLLKKGGYKIRKEWTPSGSYHPIVYAAK